VRASVFILGLIGAPDPGFADDALRLTGARAASASTAFQDSLYPEEAQHAPLHVAILVPPHLSLALPVEPPQKSV
jgi:hypothetical protein